MLQGKRVIVTGATAGIGEETARLLVERGARVAGVGRRREAGEALERELGAERFVFVQADLDDPGAAAAILAAARERLGDVDVLVNNAAIDHARPLLETPDDEVEAVFRTNFMAQFRLLREVASAWVAAGRGGAIVNVSSRLASIGVPTMGVYGAAKGALSSLTRHAAVELAPHGIRVNTVAPGPTETPLIRAWIEGHDDPVAFRETVADSIPLHALATPRDVAAAIAYLASDDAAHVTGASLAVDGGYTAK